VSSSTHRLFGLSAALDGSVTKLAGLWSTWAVIGFV
jgi:hypothetical protein